MRFYFKILCLYIIVISSFFLLLGIEKVSAQNNIEKDSKHVVYKLAWPGILPDHPLYKLKVARNKLIEKMIFNPVKKIEFDLLMADKTIFASKLLVDRNEIALAQETALKGEHYYSILVQDYNNALLKNKKIPSELDKKITLAAKKHQEIFDELIGKVDPKDKSSFEAAKNFSHINYKFIEGLRTPKKANN